MASSTVALSVPGRGKVEVRVEDVGTGRSFLLVHGGTGPSAVADFAQRFVAAHPARVILPTIPGFGGTPRPDWLDGPDVLAEALAALLDAADVPDVTVVGNSLGGWAACELALRDPSRMGAMVLLDAIGITVPGHPIADMYGSGNDELKRRIFADPARYADPPATDPAARVYARPQHAIPPLLARLPRVPVRTLVLWGERDGVVDPTYGRAYADAIPDARFVLLPHTGHHGYLESPELLVPLLWDFASSYFALKNGAVSSR